MKSRDTFKKASNITARIAARLARGEEISAEDLARREDAKKNAVTPGGQNVTASGPAGLGGVPVGEIESRRRGSRSARDGGGAKPCHGVASCCIPGLCAVSESAMFRAALGVKPFLMSEPK